MGVWDKSLKKEIASLAVAAHELGHAQQDAEGYFPLRFRAALVPAVNIGSWLGWIMIFAGLLLRLTNLAWLGVVVFSGGAVFALGGGVVGDLAGFAAAAVGCHSAVPKPISAEPSKAQMPSLRLSTPNADVSFDSNSQPPTSRFNAARAPTAPGR